MNNKNYFNNDDENNIFNEILNSLNIGKEEYDDVKISKNKSFDAMVEYEIIMNCDDSNYIIFYRK